MRYLLFSLILLMVSACRDQTPPERLIGQWQAHSLTVADSAWQVQVDPILLSFTPDRHYHLEWYGGQSESGQYHVKSDWLHIQSAETPDRKLRIMHLSNDSLLLSGTLQDRRTVIGFNRIMQPSTSE
ncbi:MAG: hypothetical protein K9I85_08395 [Saprospiraceae bacterium]|nr:hypothetical protein [Saprospiraceae bacterium]